MPESTELRFEEKPGMEDPILVEGLPGIGYVGKLAVDHLIEVLEAEKFGEMVSFYFPHHVTVSSEGVLDSVKIEFYHVNLDDLDLILVAGDVQATSSEGHYVIANKLLDTAEELGVKNIFALGGYATGKHFSSKPKVVGASNDEDTLQKYRDHGIDVEEGSGPIIGISGLLLGLGKDRDFEGSALLGETHGMMVDHRSAKVVLEALADLLGFEVDVSELKERAKKTEDILSRLRKEQKLRQVGDFEEEEEDLSYIG